MRLVSDLCVDIFVTFIQDSIIPLTMHWVSKFSSLKLNVINYVASVLAEAPYWGPHLQCTLMPMHIVYADVVFRDFDNLAT